MGQPIDEKAIHTIELELQIKGKQIKQVIELLEEGNTVPFIARYRKELTGGLDEVQIKDIMDRWTYLENLTSRKEEVIRLIEEQGKLTEELSASIQKATKLQEVEDLYRPFKQKGEQRQQSLKKKGSSHLLNGYLNKKTAIHWLKLKNM